MKAFPWLEKLDSTDPTVINPVSHGGMDLRDYFASKCITYSLAACSSTIQDACELSYQIADAMMKARKV